MLGTILSDTGTSAIRVRGDKNILQEYMFIPSVRVASCFTRVRLVHDVFASLVYLVTWQYI